MSVNSVRASVTVREPLKRERATVRKVAVLTVVTVASGLSERKKYEDESAGEGKSLVEDNILSRL